MRGIQGEKRFSENPHAGGGSTAAVVSAHVSFAPEGNVAGDPNNENKNETRGGRGNLRLRGHVLPTRRPRVLLPPSSSCFLRLSLLPPTALSPL